MRILFAPLGMPLPTMGPAGRVISLTSEAVAKGHETAVCAALDGNLKPEALPQGVRWFTSPKPNLLGLPRPLASLLPRLMALAGMGRRAKVKSFEQVLFLGGNLSPDFVRKDVRALRQAIREFQPDLVFSEYRYQAIVAAKLENKPLAGTHSFPGRAQYASSPQFSVKVRAWLKSEGFGGLASILELFEMQEPRFVASSPELEPFPETVVHVGPITPQKAKPEAGANRNRDAVVAYVGGGGVPEKQLIHTLRQVARELEYRVFIAAGKKTFQEGDLHVAPRLDFSNLLPRAAVFLNHGGQNSIMDGLLAGTPQIMIPCQVFERIYNADSVARLGAGEKMELEDFQPDKFKAALARLMESPAADRAREVGQNLASLGGAARVLDILEKAFGEKE